MKYLILLGLLALSKAYPNPQGGELNKLLSDIDESSPDGERYGNTDVDLENLDLEAIFGNPTKPYDIQKEEPREYEDTIDEVIEDSVEEEFETVNNGVPKDIIVDTSSKFCAFYNESGYRCVPYYSCDGGEIIIDGAGLFNPRFGGLDDVELNPETSKCPGSFEMCCRYDRFYLCQRFSERYSY